MRGFRLAALIPVVVAVSVFGCGRSFSAPSTPTVTVAVAVDQQQVAPRGFTGVRASGGFAPYTFALIDAQSGPDARLFPDGGYLAGSQGNVTDRLQATDARGNVGTAAVHVGPPLQISPASASAHPGESVAFLAQGGQPPYQFRLAPHGNASFGAVTGAGVYTAGPNPNQLDLVEAVDANGASSVAPVSVLDTLLPVEVLQAVTPTRADVNGDGTDDLVVQSGTELNVFVGTPAGLVAADTIELPCVPLRLKTLDLDGDSFDDVLAQCEHEMLLLHGTFDGRLVPDLAWPWHFEVDGGPELLDLGAIDLAPATRKKALAALLFTTLNSAGQLDPAMEVAVFTEAGGSHFATELGDAPLAESLAIPVDLSFLNPANRVLLAGSSLRTSGPAAIVSAPLYGVPSLVTSIAAIRQQADGGLFVAGMQGAADPKCGGVDVAQLGLADLDGDGKPDLYGITAPDSSGMASLCVGFGTSDGSFIRAVSLAVPADLNNLHELVPAHSFRATRLLDATRDGGYEVDVENRQTAIIDQPFPSDFLATASGDFNGDGIPDLASVDDANHVRIFAGDFQQDFRRGRIFHQQPQPASSDGTPATRLGWSTVDGAVAGVAANADGLRVLEASASGLLSEQAHLFPNHPVADVRMDSQGLWALIGTRALRLQPGDGGWQGPSIDLSALYLSFADELNAGGAIPGADLALLMDHHIEILQLTADGGITSFEGPPTLGGFAGVHASGAALDDMVITADPSQGTFAILPPLADGGAGWSTDVTLRLGPEDFGLDAGSAVDVVPFAFAAHVGDRPDCLLFRNVGVAMVYDFGRRRGAILGAGFVRDALLPAASADLDGDGLNDLVLTRDDGIELVVSVFLAKPDGSFDEHDFDIPGAPYMQPLAMDLDGDGRADLALFDDVHGEIEVVRNQPLPDGGLTLY